jgi:type V secretory pathway adhesin AidA
VQLELELAPERAWQPRDGSNVTYLHTSGAVVGLNQGLLARLEAENAQLRGSVVDLLLQIQALRDGSTSRNRF